MNHTFREIFPFPMTISLSLFLILSSVMPSPCPESNPYNFFFSSTMFIRKYISFLAFCAGSVGNYLTRPPLVSRIPRVSVTYCYCIFRPVFAVLVPVRRAHDTSLRLTSLKKLIFYNNIFE